MRAHGQAKLGFYPLPVAEADRLKSWLNFQDHFSALDPCVGDGAAFAHLLADAPARRYGIEVDAYRAEFRLQRFDCQGSRLSELRLRKESPTSRKRWLSLSACCFRKASDYS